MTGERPLTIDAESAVRVCPFLGLPDDPDSHYSFAELAHRCHAKRKAEPIELGYQVEFCLGGKYDACSRFRAAERPIPAWHPAARNHPAIVKGLRTKLGLTGTRRAGAALLAAALIAVTALGALMLLAGGAFSEPAGTIADGALADVVSPTPPAATVQLTPTVPPTPMPTASPTPAPTATRAPTMTPYELTPTPAPSPPIHVVQRGETLSYIASLYGVSAGEIAAANGIENKNRIYIGQELVIPVP